MAPWSTGEKAAFRAEHPVCMPIRQPVHNFPHADLAAYFGAIFAADCVEYKGLVSIAAKKPGHSAPELIATVPAEQLAVWASQMHVSPRLDYYFGKAQHSGDTTWGTENAFAFNMLAVDIDAHTAETRDVSVERKLIDTVVHGLESSAIPTPNIIEDSGRGYHLVWLINQVPATLEWMVRAVASYYANAVQNILRDTETNLLVDSGYSANVAGLTRIPGTYNTAANAYATYTLYHSIRVDLPKAYDSLPITGVRKNHVHSAESLGLNRLAALRRYADLRGDLTGCRHTYLLIVFSAAQASGMSNDEAMDYVQNVNLSLPAPLSARDVATSLRTAAIKHYKYKNDTIVNLLGITPNEEQVIGLTASKRDSNRARNKRRQDKRIARDRDIMRLHLLGRTVSEIAKQMRHAYNTVRAVIKRYGSNLSDLYSRKELMHLRKLAAKALVAKLNPEDKEAEPKLFKNGSAKYYAYTTLPSGQMSMDLGPPTILPWDSSFALG